jgi:hypothetical protein
MHRRAGRKGIHLVVGDRAHLSESRRERGEWQPWQWFTELLAAGPPVCYLRNGLGEIGAWRCRTDAKSAVPGPQPGRLGNVHSGRSVETGNLTRRFVDKVFRLHSAPKHFRDPKGGSAMSRPSSEAPNISGQTGVPRNAGAHPETN